MLEGKHNHEHAAAVLPYPLDVLEGADEGGHGLRLPVWDHEEHERLALPSVRPVRPEKPSPLELHHVSLAHVAQPRVA